MKEKQVGETFRYGMKKFIVVSDFPVNYPDSCSDCFFEGKDCSNDKLECRKDHRADGLPIHFEEVK